MTAIAEPKITANCELDTGVRCQESRTSDIGQDVNKEHAGNEVASVNQTTQMGSWDSTTVGTRPVASLTDTDYVSNKQNNALHAQQTVAIYHKPDSKNKTAAGNKPNTCTTVGKQIDLNFPLGVTLSKDEVTGSMKSTKRVGAKSKDVSENTVPTIVNFYVFNVNSDSDGVSAVKSIIEQTSKQPITRPVCILPKPPHPCTVKVVNKMQENEIKMLNNGSGVSKTSSVVQTSDFPIDRTSAETQTTGDYVLMKAMQCANIPIQKESRGAQVSPRAKIHGVKRTIPTQTTSIQTGTEARPVVRRKRRKKLPKWSEAAMASTSTSFSEASSLQFSVPDLLDFGFSDNETQTIAMIEELEASLAASISTQTRESFLANPAAGQEMAQSLLPMQTIETQTLTIDSECDATGFSLLNFLNTAENANDSQSSGIGTPSIPPFDQPMSLSNPMIPQGEDLPLSLPTPEPQPMIDVLNPGSSLLYDASAQTTEISNAIQTQTIDTMFSQLLSNMETQTSDDLPLLELGFMDNETQTPFDLDPIGSQANVETQTSLHVSAQSSNNVQSIDTETQTLFPNLSSADTHTQTSLADLEKFMNL
jgi:hypothetical protein